MTLLRRTLLPWLATAVLVGLCLLPKAWMPHGEGSSQSIRHLDKVIHFGMFAGFAFCWAIAGRSPSPSRSRVAGVLAVSFALAVGTELLQSLPQIQRDPDPFDALADVVGALAGAGAAVVLGAAWVRARGATAFVGVVLACLVVRGAEASEKVIIEFGWDEPDTTFLRKNIEAMERSPFDGCVFHAAAKTRGGTVENFAWKAWGRRTFTEAELAGAFEDLSATRPRRFTSNLLRVNTTPADLDWFDDFTAVVANARLAARLALAGRCRGVLLDTEAYEAPLFSYRKQRNAPERSWDDYAAQVRRRGEEVMAAFQDEFPGLTVLLTFGPSLVLKQTRDGTRPIEDAPDGLLAPFVAGLASAAKGETTVIDGHEPSYGYRNPEQFDTALAAIRKSGGPKVRAGFGLWLDYDWQARGWNSEDPSKNYFTPELFETSLRTALDRTDGVVWVYTETPRWWTESGQPSKLPAAYADALRRSRPARPED
jgi:hypothetical protein